MKRMLFSFLSLFISIVALAQSDLWNENTRDAAYEAPNSLLQKKWYKYDKEKTTSEFKANGEYINCFQMTFEEVNVSIEVSGKYTRNKDRITISLTDSKVIPNQSDLEILSARRRDEFLARMKLVEQNIKTAFRQMGYYLILRLDEDYLITTTFDPKTQMFNDMSWDTWHTKPTE